MSFKRLFFLLFITILLFLSVSYLFISNFSKETFLSLEKEEAKAHAEKIELYFERELTNLYNLTKDWAAWDDAYLFMQNKNPDFVKKNIIPETFKNLKIDLLLYTYLDGNVKAGGLYDRKTQKIFISAELLNLVKSLIEKSSSNTLQGTKCFLFFMNKPFFLAVYPVLRSDFRGSERGYLFMGRFLNDEDRNIIINFFKIKDFEILRSGEPFKEIRFLKADLNEIVLEKSPFLANDKIKIRITYPVKETLINSLTSYTVFIQIILLIIFGIIVSFLLDQYVLKPFFKLLKEINQIKDKEITKLSLEYKIKEYVDLGLAINKFLEDISIREEIYRSIAEKTENIIVLFDKDKTILFQNANTSKYFNSEELKSLVESFFEEGKYLKNSIKELKIKNYWFSFQIIPISEILFLLIGQDITTIKAREEELFKLATRDFLTNLYNRRYLEDTLNRVIASSKRGEKFVFLFIDCNDLKKINDEYGHLVGDEVLKSIARSIRKSVRDEDVAARWGGDEFAVILNHCDKTAGIKIAQRIIENLSAEEIKVNSEKIKPSVSIGVVEIDGTMEIGKILDLADKLCYKSKETGKIEV